MQGNESLGPHPIVKRSRHPFALGHVGHSGHVGHVGHTGICVFAYEKQIRFSLKEIHLCISRVKNGNARTYNRVKKGGTRTDRRTDEHNGMLIWGIVAITSLDDP